MATTARDFEFDRIEAFVKKHGATVLALQFPAHLLAAAPAVATALAARLGAAPEIYVLGDPVPRGAVDCVGAAHVDADALVKCGADCLTPPPDGAPPTLFVRGPAAAVDVAGVARHIEELLIEEGPVLLLVAPEHADFGGALAAELETRVGPSTASRSGPAAPTKATRLLRKSASSAQSVPRPATTKGDDGPASS